MLEYHTWSTRLKALRCKLFGRSDVGRWSDASTFESWEERSRIIASLLPAGAHVLDIGAGARTLERHIDRQCHYTPCDIVSRGADTIILDLNKRPLPALDTRYDGAVMAGLLEYIADLPSFLSWLSTHVDFCVASYGCATKRAGPLTRLVQTMTRAGAGWVNGYTEPELIGLFDKNGFLLNSIHDWKHPDGDERIFRFDVTDRKQKDLERWNRSSAG